MKFNPGDKYAVLDYGRRLDSFTAREIFEYGVVKYPTIADKRIGYLLKSMEREGLIVRLAPGKFKCAVKS